MVFGFRAPPDAFIAMVAFAGLVAVSFAVARRHDRISCWLIGSYLLWVVGYDIPGAWPWLF